MAGDPRAELLDALDEALRANTFVKLTLGKGRDRWRQAFIRLVEIRKAPHLSVLLRRDGAADATENHPIADARALGIHVAGPIAADSVFHLALHGAFDAVLSLYHDQGHIATKMVDFQRTIAITLGLPFLRTSVDHGTAFDLAGTGAASALSLEEAIRLAAIYAPRYRPDGLGNLSRPE